MAASVSSFVALYVLLGLFWVTPSLVVSSPPPPAEVTGAALLLYIFGFFLLHTGDAQKYFTLRHRPNHLIDDALFARTRNPNYLGELLIYSAFAMSSCTSSLWYAPWAVNILVWSILFVPNWVIKDRSLSRHEGWTRYRQRSGMVLPWLFGDGWWGEA